MRSALIKGLLFFQCTFFPLACGTARHLDGRGMHDFGVAIAYDETRTTVAWNWVLAIVGHTCNPSRISTLVYLRSVTTGLACATELRVERVYWPVPSSHRMCAGGIQSERS